MNGHVFARSISRPVHELLSSGGRIAARVLGSSPYACNLLSSDGDALVLASPTVGDGPLNIVVEAGLGDVPKGTPGVIENGVLSLAGLAVSIKEAEVWEPCPDWADLTSRRSQAAEQLPILWAMAERLAPRESLLGSVLQWRRGAESPTGPLQARFWEGAKALAAGWGGSQEQAALGAAQLAGLGIGLTPAGDDFLLGSMLWAWLMHPSPRAFCQVLAEAAVSQTTTLSAAWLRAAADGQFGAPLHRLLAALVGRGDLETATRRLLLHGATSGGDTLAGMLWMGECRPPLASPGRLGLGTAG